MSHRVPQPRYSPEHKAQSAQEQRPLFTLDIWYPGERRSTISGVLVDAEIEDAVAKLQRVRGMHADMKRAVAEMVSEAIARGDIRLRGEA